jgi:hypothetical protein
MKLATSIVVISLFTSSGTSYADPLTNMICGLLDIEGNKLAYAFGPNSPATGVNKIGTVTETGYSRNSVAPPYPNGRYPIWSFRLVDNGITIMTPQDTPEWKLIASVPVEGKFPVVLMKGGSLRAYRKCAPYNESTPS